MTHEQATGLLLDLAYGELAPDVAREVSQHAAGCAECADELARIAVVRGVAAKLEDRPPGTAAREELVAAAQRAALGRRPRRWLGRPATLSFAAAAVVVIVAGVTLKLTREDLGAPDRLHRVEQSVAPRAPEPPTAEERREPQPERATPAEPQRAVPAPAVRRPPAPPAHAPAPAPVPSPGAAPEAAAPARKRAQSNAASDVAAPPTSPAPASTAGAAASKRAVAPRGATGLVEERRQLRCGDVLVERVALVAPGGRVVKLTERRGEAVVEGSYDEDGRLRDADTARRQEAAAGGPALALPTVAPSLDAVGTACAW